VRFRIFANALQICGIAVLFFEMTHGAKAELRVADETSASIRLEINGAITKRDAEQFETLSPRFVFEHVLVNLDSKGGDAIAAMEIGRIIRRYDGSTYIQFANCYSACALIFIAGVTRTNIGGKLGLDRPDLASVLQSRETAEKRIPLTPSAIKSYVQEMRIGDVFYQQMINTEPSKMVIYMDRDTEKIVPEWDPVFDENGTSVRAGIYGITTAEMRQREQNAKTCSNVPAFDQGDCKEAIKWGLSFLVYLDRNEKSKKECWFDEKHRFNEQDEKTFWATPTAERLDLPFSVRWQECQRDVMLGKR
jgi:hypothetical protein